MEKKQFEYMEEVIKHFLDGKNWRYNYMESAGFFEFYAYLTDANKELRYTIDVRRNAYIIIAALMLDECPDYRVRSDNLSNFANLVNEELSVGNFYVNHRTQEICYKLTHESGTQELSKEDIEKKIYYVASKMQYYTSGFESVLRGVEPIEALEQSRRKLVNRIFDSFLKNADND